MTINGKAVGFDTNETTLEFPPGQADLPTLRLTAHFVAALPTGTNTWQVDYRDDNYPERIGWQEVLVRANIGTRVLDSTVSDQDVSQELRTYPVDLLQNPLKVNSATFEFTTDASTAASNGTISAGQADRTQSSSNDLSGPTRTTDRFAELITAPILGPGAFLLMILAAFGWGALHAFSPGHGKTIVGAYLVGSRGTVSQALFLGLVTTITHTAGVFAFGLITLLASQYFLPETLFPWLSLLSGLMVVTIGISLARSRFQSILPSCQSTEPLTNQDHAGGNLLHEHIGGFAHQHTLTGPDGAKASWRNLLVLGVSGGIIPCPSALVMMLGAIALQKVALGLLLIIIFSVGLASVLTVFGMLFIHTSKLFQRIPESCQQR